jgi:8-oxo-dGTP pyrophosphatase MutT (NUDIX family)
LHERERLAPLEQKKPLGNPLDKNPLIQGNGLVLSHEHLHKLQMELARQVAALPVRREADGSVHVLLVTSRGTGRWVIPKGWPWHGCEDCVAAAHEAREEAGVLGLVQSQPLGSFVYEKRRSSGHELVRADVYMIEVASLLESWPEQDERQRAWFTLEDAANVVSDQELRDLLQAFGNR